MLTVVHDIDMKREGREKGLEIGREQGRLTSLIDLVKDGLLCIDVATDRAGMSVEEFEKAMKQEF